MKLSRKASNNIIIFAMLAMIMLFNIDAWLPKPDTNLKVRLIAESDLLLQLQVGEGRIERVGTDWRYTGINSSAERPAGDVITQWLAARLAASVYPDNVDKQSQVTLWLARAEDPIRIELLKTNNKSYAVIGDSVYSIENVDFSDLVF